MSRNTQSVETYMDGLRKNDHAQILPYLTDDMTFSRSTGGTPTKDILSSQAQQIKPL